MNRKSTSSNIAEVFPVSVAFHVRPPNAQSFPALFRGLPCFNISGKDFFCSAHVDEVSMQRASLSVHNSGFTITEPSQIIFCIWIWEEARDGVCSVRSFFILSCGCRAAPVVRVVLELTIHITTPAHMCARMLTIRC